MPSGRYPLTVPTPIAAFTEAAGIGFHGDQPWDIEVRDGRLFADLMRRGSLALGEGYVNGLWDCKRLDQLFTRLLTPNTAIDVMQGFDPWAQLRSVVFSLGERLLNWQTHLRAHQVARRHYDIDPRVYAAMLDSRRIYSCAYWQHASSLEEAQEHKLKLICEKLQLEPGQRLLDLGCGWGGFSRYAAENYGVEVLGITVSAHQQRYAQGLALDLPVRTVLADYRTALLRQEKPFDRIVSIGMMEHVGRLNDSTFFQIVKDLLTDDGLMLLQSIGTRQTTAKIDPWINTYIFPNGRLPSALQLCRGFECSLILQDWENFGRDYDTTLMAWWTNFDAAWPRLSQDIAPSFYRLWSYYLLSCAGLFRSGQGQLWQLVLSKPSRQQTYRSIRPGICRLSPEIAASAPQLGS
jgi:cyclopropane-fatty-acyl-phospholipid synthase